MGTNDILKEKKKQTGASGTDLSDSGQGSMADCFKHYDKPSGYIKCGDSLASSAATGSLGFCSTHFVSYETNFMLRSLKRHCAVI